MAGPRGTTRGTLTPQEAGRLDRNAGELGVPVARLMQAAGAALAQAALRERVAGAGVWLLCGKGNNGGDGFAAAGALLREGVPARVLLAEPASAVRSGAARSFLAALPEGVAQPFAPAKPPEGTVLVDCLLGAGLSGRPRPPYDRLVRFLNAQRERCRIVACDVPSGLGSGLAVHPHRTVALHARKPGMAAANAGRIEVADIGIPPAAADVGLGDLELGYPRPRHDSHKGDNGVVAVVAGGPYTGAPFYTAMAAHRAGADLVLAALPEDAARVVQAYRPEPMVHATEPGARLTPRSLPAIRPLLRRATALVLGPGLGSHRETLEAARQVLAEAARLKLPTVVDADGLDALTPALLRSHGRRMVLTPHGKEFRDLAGVAAGEASVAAYARRHGTTVLWKRDGAFIADRSRQRSCRRGHPTMTVGGTGDVLAGVVGELLAKGTPPFEAACAGAYLVGCAGELAAEVRSYGATAVDILDAVPAILLRLP